MWQPGPYDDPGCYRAQLRPELQEVAMHPQIAAMAAAEHVKDMQASANRGRRAREARRPRRGAITISAPVHPHRPAEDPCPQVPCQPLSSRARGTRKVATQ